MTIPNVSRDDRLTSIVSRIVRVEEERRSLGADVKDLYKEAKSAGYEPAALRIVVKRSLEDSDKKDKREAAEAEAELMLARLGEFAESPLGAAAVARVRG